jgi:leucyl-tRNA synthetase
VHQQAWPKYDVAMAAKSVVTIVVQVSGKVRDRIEVPAGKSKAELERLALASPKVQAALEGAKPVNIIVVPDRLVNVVVKK